MSDKRTLDFTQFGVEPKEEEKPIVKTPRTLSFEGQKTVSSGEGRELDFTRKAINDPSRVLKTNNDTFVDVHKILKEYDRPLIKEDFMNDKRLQELVITNLEARMRPEGFVGGARGLATKLVGGQSIDPRDYRSMDFEDVFETWQNYQRSFAAGQSVTTGNEVAYTIQSNDDTKAKLGAGYVLFDSMDNAFTGEGSWAEMADAMWDYTRGVVWDPTTIVSLGIGKALTSASSKAAAHGVRHVATTALKQGLTKKAVGAAVRAAPYMAPDLALNIGLDVAYQHQMIRTGVQEDYSYLQTGIAAAGTMAIPMLFGGTKAIGSLRKGPLKNTFLGYENIANKVKDLSPEETWIKVGSLIDKDLIIDGLDDQFGKVNGNFSKLLEWTDAKSIAKGLVKESPDQFKDTELFNMFKRYFFFGSDKGNQKGFIHMLQDAGFYPMRQMLKDETQNPTSIYGQAITFLSDDVVEKIVKGYEDTVGRKLGIGYTADELAAHFMSDASIAGQTLQISSQLDNYARAGLKGKKLMKAAVGDSPKRFQYSLSVYKRLLTSHLATTGANIKGFTQLVGINTVADFVSAASYGGQASLYKLIGDVDAAGFYGRRAKGSFMAPFRRVANMLSPDLTMEYADTILDANPDFMERLFRDIAGDGGVRDSLAHFNLDKAGKAWRVADNVTKGAQTLTMVRLQDDITKRWAFGSNLDTWIMKEYGVNPQRFFNRTDVMTEMASPRFRDVLDRAAFDTLRETASVNWSILPGKEAFKSARWWAKTVELGTNNSPLGFVVPFGSFLNTTIATMGDLSGVNAFRAMYKSATGKAIDYADDEFSRLFGKAVAGWSIVLMGVPGAQERIEKGLAWSDQEQSDGSITNIKYDWPGSTIRLASTILAHALDGNSIEHLDLADFSRVPEDLMTEMYYQLGGQAIRDIDDVRKTMGETLREAVETGSLSSGALGFLTSMGARVAQGVTRPLDPINQLTALMSDDMNNPDLKQGPKKLNEALRYVDHIFGTSQNLPARANAVRGYDQEITIGKQILGNRVTKDPNITEQMFNAAGYPTWKAVRWNGPEKVKNYMDGVISGFFHEEATRALKANPTYFKMNQSDKDRILEEVRKRARESTLYYMKNAPMPKTLEASRVLATADKDKVSKVVEFLGYESIEELLEQDDALEKLNKIKIFVDNYDNIFNGDLNLD